MSEYTLFGKQISFTQAETAFCAAMCKVEHDCLNAIDNFDNWYDNCGNITNVLSGYRAYVRNTVLLRVIGGKYNILLNNGIYDISESDYIDTIIDNSFLDSFRKILGVYKSIEDNLEDEIEDALREEGIALDEAGKFVDEILSSIPSHVWTGCKNVSDVFYSDNTHFRTYSSDYGRISSAISRAKQVEFTRLYNYFVGSEEAPSALNALEYPEKWKQLIISYLYFVLSSEVNMDYGIGIGGHQWEYQPPRTMLAEETPTASERVLVLSAILCSKLCKR